MPAPIKFNDFSNQLAKKGHNLDTDTLKVAFTNVLPVASALNFDPATAHAAPTAANGYTAGGYDILNSIAAAGGVATLNGTDFTITAAGGSIGPFRYMLLYNATNPSDAVVHYYDHGSSITLADGESFTFDLLTNILTLT